MKQFRFVTVTFVFVILAGSSGHLLAQRMHGQSMQSPQQKSPGETSGESSQQREPGSRSEMGPPHPMGPGMMGPGSGMMGHGMMGSGTGIGGGLGPGMGMMGSMMRSMMESPQMMGLMMSMHGEMMALMGRMMQRYGGEQTPEVQQKMRTEMLQEMGDILIKHGNRLKETATSSGR